MIEVLFGESEAGSMKAAKNKIISMVFDGPTAYFCAGRKKPPQKERGEWIEGTSDEVICLGFMLDIGELNQDICGEYRKNLIYSMLNQGQWDSDSEIDKEFREAGNVYIRELERLKAFLETGEDIRIWYSRSAYSLCGLYHVCSLLMHYSNRIFLVELPEYSIDKNVVSSHQNWGEIAADEFSVFLGYQREINQMEVKRYAQIWTELVADNSPLRSLVNNHVISVNEDFYDFLIWKRLTTKPIKEARLIGDIMGYYRIGVGDWWYAKRIQYYIDNGKIEVVEDSENKYARLIKER